MEPLCAPRTLVHIIYICLAGAGLCYYIFCLFALFEYNSQRYQHDVASLQYSTVPIATAATIKYNSIVGFAPLTYLSGYIYVFFNGGPNNGGSYYGGIYQKPPN